MKVLVTGGAGFIGSHIVDALVAEGHDVAVVDDLSTGRREFVHPEARFYQVDIRDGAALEAVFARERPELVSHQAAKADVRESMLQPLLYADVNVLGSLRLLELSREYGVKKVIYASTGGAVYGEPQYLPVDEAHPVNPLDHYGAGKHHVEHYLYLYSANYGLAYASLRYPNVYGPRQDPHGEAGVVAIFTHKMLAVGQTSEVSGTSEVRAVINGSGEQERDFVYVGDIVTANLLCMDRGEGIYNIGSGTGTSINDLFWKLKELTGYPLGPVYGPPKLGEVFKICLDATRAQQELGWTPQVSLHEGLTRTVEYFKHAHRD